ncbi:hypothetical protein EDB89DRAFT_1911094 [Lactarius sanguifluus]|nr:hypothetical protein EDB89DRAFT_1911094 [Lactarius sanguifluus]
MWITVLLTLKDLEFKNCFKPKWLEPYFSTHGDLGSVIADSLGHIGGILTGGAGKTVSSDITYATPFFWLLPHIKQNGFPLLSTELTSKTSYYNTSHQAEMSMSHTRKYEYSSNIPTQPLVLNSYSSAQVLCEYPFETQVLVSQREYKYLLKLWQCPEVSRDSFLALSCGGVITNV